MTLTTRYVQGIGPRDSKMWFIGEAPGREENLAGQPFVGAAGRLLNQCFKTVGITRTSVRLDNCFRRRPPDNDILYFFEGHDKKLRDLTEEGAEYVEELKRDLEVCRPNLVIALGAIPLRLLCSKWGITKWRGSVLPCTLVEGLKVYACNHPSAVQRAMQEKGEEREEKGAPNLLPIFILDLQRALEQSEFPDIRYPERRFDTGLSCAQILHWIDQIPPGSSVMLDIETLPPAKLITRVGLAISESHALSIPFVRSGAFCWTSGEFAALLQGLDRLHKREDIEIQYQGGIYDIVWNAKYWRLSPGDSNIGDLMVLHHATYPHLPKGLAAIASFHTWEPYYKDDGKIYNIRVGDEALSVYNAKDCAVQHEAFRKVRQKCRDLGMISGYERSMTYMPSLIAMALRGVRCDLGKRTALIRSFNYEIEQIDKRITEVMGRSYNISTSFTKDLANLLYVDCKFRPQMKNGKLTTEADAIRRIGKLYPDHPIPKLVLTKRKYMKLVSTYLEMTLGPDGRIRTKYDPTGTVTWRLSSSESNLGEGANLQNIPKHTDAFTGLDIGKEIRKIFVADPGKVLLASDLIQAEAMYVAWEAHENIEIEAFKKGLDIHWINARDILDLGDLERDKDSPDHKNKRELGKTVKHATNYEMGPHKLQKELLKRGFDLELEECIGCIARIKSKRPMIQLWKRSIREKIDTDRLLETPLGRRRYFYGRKSDDLYRKAYAFKPQSTVGELTCMGIRDVHKDCEVEIQLLEMLLNVHDEMVVQLEPSRALEAAHLIRERFERQITVGGMPLTIPCDFKIGENWGEMEEFKI